MKCKPIQIIVLAVNEFEETSVKCLAYGLDALFSFWITVMNVRPKFRDLFLYPKLVENVTLWTQFFTPKEIVEKQLIGCKIN